MADAEAGMSKADLKKLLNISKEQPVNCALGFTKDKQALILLHKTKQPRALVKELEKEAGGALVTPCFGTASVDEAADPTIVILTVNKAPGGLAARLKKTLAGTGYKKAVIHLEDGTVVAEEEDGEPAADQPAAPVEAAPEPDALSADALSKELASLARRIPDAAGSDAALKARLLTLAKDANARIKAGDLPGAAGLLAELAQGLAPGAGTDAPGGAAVKRPAPIGSVKAAAAREGEAKPAVRSVSADGLRLWRDAREEVDGDISELQDYLRKVDDPNLKAIGEHGLSSRTQGLNAALMKALIEVDTAAADQRDAKAKSAADAVQSYRAFLQNDRLIGLLEDNPFGIGVDITGRLNDALDSIEAALAR